LRVLWTENSSFPPHPHIRQRQITGGEPFLHQKELVALIRPAGEAGIPFIRTETNGYLFMGHEKPDFDRRIAAPGQTLAATPLCTFWIGVDSSVPEIHERMRGLAGVIMGIEKALLIFHGHGIFPSANLGTTWNVVISDKPGVIYSGPKRFEMINLGVLINHIHPQFRGYSKVGVILDVPGHVCADNECMPIIGIYIN
jgi:hypothetical protein